VLLPKKGEAGEPHLFLANTCQYEGIQVSGATSEDSILSRR
jgi:hypothetical protein